MSEDNDRIGPTPEEIDREIKVELETKSIDPEFVRVINEEFWNIL